MDLYSTHDHGPISIYDPLPAAFTLHPTEAMNIDSSNSGSQCVTSKLEAIAIPALQDRLLHIVLFAR